MSDWHFELSDGQTTLKFLCASPNGEEQSLRHWSRVPLEKSAMKLGSGRAKYDDLLPPWYAIAQDDWSGGRGTKELVDDPTEYWDATGVQTWIPERLVLGPQRHEDTLPVGKMYGWDNPDAWDTTPAGTYTGQTFTSYSTVTCDGIKLIHNWTGLDALYVTVELWGVTAQDQPDLNNKLGGGTWKIDGGSAAPAVITVMMSTPVELLADTKYAVTVNAYGGATSVNIRKQSADTYLGTLWHYNSATSTWEQQTGDLSFVIHTEGYQVLFFGYKGLLYAVVDYGDKGSNIVRRGRHGKAVAGGRNTITLQAGHATNTVGETIRLIAETGEGQWATVESVNGDQVTIDRDWEIVPDNTTIYAIAGPWERLSLTDVGGVKDVLVVDEIYYITHGSNAKIVRGRWTDAFGDQWEVDGLNKADFLVEFRDENNDPAIWRALGNEISAASIQPWGVALEFGTEIRVGSDDSHITALTVYDDHLYICKEDGLFAIQEDIVRRIPVDFSALRSPYNGRNMTSWNLYLVWPLQHGLQRLYGNEVDDFGPNRGHGLPSGRQGPISAILPLPGLLVVAVDGGADGYSSILGWNNLGWHEIARSADGKEYGRRITALFYESMADDSGRLWWNEGPRIAWVWLSGRTFDRSRDDRADWAHDGQLVSGWLGTDLQDVKKLWRRVVIIKERDQTFEGSAPVRVQYRVDGEDALWQNATAVSETDTRDEFEFAAGTVGRRLQLKLLLDRGGDAIYGYTTPEIRAVTVDALGRIESAHAFRTHAVLDKIAVSMHGKPEQRDPGAVLATLDAWSETPTPLTLTHKLAEFDGLTVLLEPVEVTVGEYTGDGRLRSPRVVSLSLVELR